MTVELDSPPEHEPRTEISRLEQLVWQHLKGVEGVHRLLAREAPRFEMVDLTPALPVQTCQQVSERSPVEGIGVINLNAVSVSIGWPGNRAGQELGITVPSNSYLRVPIKTNEIDVACFAFGGATQLPVLVFQYDRPPELAAGAIVASGGSSGSTTTASAVTGASPRTVTVGTASALALAANGSRKGSSWVNTGTTTISLGLGAAAVAGDDIVLDPNGSWDGMVGPCLWQGSVYAISSAAGGTLAVVEV